METIDEYLLNELDAITNRLSVIIGELKKRDGVITTEILNRIDKINALSVEI